MVVVSLERGAEDLFGFQQAEMRREGGIRGDGAPRSRGREAGKHGVCSGDTGVSVMHHHSR